MTTPTWTVAVASGVFIVWMQRHGRWALFGEAMSGKLAIATTPRASNTPVSGKTPASGSSAGSKPAFGTQSSTGIAPAPVNARGRVPNITNINPIPKAKGTGGGAVTTNHLPGYQAYESFKGYWNDIANHLPSPGQIWNDTLGKIF